MLFLSKQCLTIWKTRVPQSNSCIWFSLHYCNFNDTGGGRGGGQAKIFGTCARSWFGSALIRYPPTIFFHRLRLHFFSTDFQDLPIFSLKFGDPIIFLRKIHIYKIFDPSTSRPVFVFKGLFCDLIFLLRLT